MTTTDVPATATVGDVPVATGGPGPPRSLRAYALATTGYLGLALVVLWHVWSSHPTTTTTCGCGDSSLFTWFLAWPAHAIAHGTSPLYSTAMFHPSGVNLLSNTGEVALGVALTPVTWWLGPIATLNVALTLSPVLSALAMFALLRRWVAWTPAAFIGGLAYGFSPVIVIALTDGHLMVAMSPIPPLIVACLDEILVRQKRRPVPTGLLLGVLVALQFFVGTEVLVICAIGVGIGLCLLLAYALWHRGLLASKVRHAAVSSVAALGTAAVLLAYPLWFALAGPAHLSGPVWGAGAPISYVATTAGDFVVPAAAIPIVGTLTHRFGGYQAPVLSGQYVGVGMVLVLVLGLVVWRRDRRLWLFTAVGAASAALSLGLRPHRWTPWRLFVHAPLLENIIPSRFLVVTYLCAGVVVGLVVDHMRSTVVPADPTCGAPGAPLPARRRRIGALLGTLVAVVALAPWVTYYAAGIPLTVQPVVLPTWFAEAGPSLPAHRVVLAFPVPFAFMQSVMTWQAVDAMHYSIAGGGGPNGLITRAGAAAPGQAVLGDFSTADPTPSAMAVSASQVADVRRALGLWQVTTVVLPDTTGLPSYVQVYQVRAIVVLMTAATGRGPVRQAGAWVWNGVDAPGRPAVPSGPTLRVCGSGPSGGSVASVARAAACVAAGGTATP